LEWGLDKQEWQNNNCSKNRDKRDKKKYKVKSKRKNHLQDIPDQEVLEDKDAEMTTTMKGTEREDLQEKEETRKMAEDKTEEKDDGEILLLGNWLRSIYFKSFYITINSLNIYSYFREYSRK
jgi:hypothetical protein